MARPHSIPTPGRSSQHSTGATASFADGHAKAELVVLLEVVDLGREEEVDALVDLLLEVCRHHTVRVDLPPESRLPEEVVIAAAGRRFPGVPVPHQVGGEGRLQRHTVRTGKA